MAQGPEPPNAQRASGGFNVLSTSAGSYVDIADNNEREATVRIIVKRTKRQK